MKKVLLLGSTGSIGRNTIQVIGRLKKLKIIGIAAFTNFRLLIRQAQEMKPKMVTLIHKKFCKHVQTKLTRTKIFCGEEGITEMVDAADADIIVCALSSSLGIEGILKAIEKRMRICLATKEILVSYGDIVMHEVKKHKVTLIPVDSEHSAIYQCLEGHNMHDVANVYLTASGGPFLNRTIKNVAKKDVLRHPVWKMGKKITVDSATMMNKGLEVIEAHHLFDLPGHKIRVVVHPQALCHSLVQFVDGTLLAQVSSPDMRLPIQYALTAPQRAPAPVDYLDIQKVKELNFQPPNFKKFPCLKLAYDALAVGKSMPAVLNAANAEAVTFFLDDKLRFDEIPKVINRVMMKHSPTTGGIKRYREVEEWARKEVRQLIC